MGFVEWDVTSLTTGRQTDDEAYGFYFGTKHGVAGYWLKIPESVPAIGNITLIGVAGNDPVGLTFLRGQTTNPIEYVAVARTITSFEKGGRWINLGTTTPGANMAVGSNRKRVRLYYSTVNEPVGPTA